MLPQKRPFVTLLTDLKNEGIECKKLRVSDSNDYLLYNFSEVSKVSVNYDKKELLLETINSEHLEFMLYILEGKR